MLALVKCTMAGETAYPTKTGWFTGKSELRDYNLFKSAILSSTIAENPTTSWGE